MVLVSSAVMLFLLPYVLFSTFLKLFLTCKQESGSSATDAAGLMWDYVTSTSLTSTSSCRYLFFSDVIMNMEISLACEPTCFLSLLTLVLLASACRHTLLSKMVSSLEEKRCGAAAGVERLVLCNCGGNLREEKNP